MVPITTIALTAFLSNSGSADTASSMLVLTGHRTRDWSAPNSYSMHSNNEDHHARLYSCMMQAGIDKVGTTEFRKTINGFRQDAKAHYNCGPESDRGWPRDLGFVRCLQKHFGATFHQSNVFLKCLDLSEGVMVESIQSPNSALFLGSFNFVAMLMASLAVISTFLVFTAGCGWNDDEMALSKYGHIKGYWSALSAFNTNFALIWSILMLGSSLYYTFPLNDTWSDIPAVEGRHGFPTTPWGGYLSTLVFLGMTTFFFTYYLQWYFDDKPVDAISRVASGNYDLVPADSSKAQIVFQDVNNAPQIVPPILVGGTSFRGSQDFVGGVPVTVATLPASFLRKNRPPPPSGTAPPVPIVPTFVQSRYWRPNLHHLGVRASTADYLHRIENNEYTHYNYTPFLNKAFACALLFADILLFVGMLNAQNSPLTESVVYVGFYIFLCRAYQFTATYFIDRVVFEQEDGKKHHQPNIVTACLQLCSLWCYVVCMLHFNTCFNITYSIFFQSIGNQTYGLQLSFVILMSVMEAVRHGLLFLTVIFGLSASRFVFTTKLIFTMDCALRILFAVLAAMLISGHLGTLNNTLVLFLMQRMA